MTGGVIAIFAHPDDESLLTGATLAACAAAGVAVNVVSATRGEHGSGTLGDDLGARRVDELREASAALGVSRWECLDYGDGWLPWIDHDALTDDLAGRLRAAAPRAVITFGADGLYGHGDHVALHHVVVAAYKRSLEPSTSALYAATWPHGLAAELVARAQACGGPVGLWGLTPDAFGVPATAITTTVDARAFTAAKLQALRAHRSQVRSGHLLHAIPLEHAAELLGREHFVLIEGDDDPLPRLALAEGAAA